MPVRNTLPSLRFVLAVLAAQVASPLSAQSIVPTDVALNPVGLERAWWNQATTNPLRDKIQHLVVDEDLLYVQSSGGIVTAFDSETGRRLWATQIGRQDDPTYAAVSNDEFAIIVIGVRMYALAKKTGEILWELRLPSAPSTSPAIDDLNVYVGCLDGSLYAFGLQPIRDLYLARRLPQWGYEAIQWKYQTPASIMVPALSVKDTVSFSSRTGNLYTVTKDGGELVWEFETDAPSSAPLSRKGSLVYLPSEDFDLYCLDLSKNGETRWRFVAGSPLEEKAMIIGDDLFLTPQAAGMFCLSADSGSRRWWRPNVVEFLAATPRMVYASDERDNLLIMRRDTGAVVGALPMLDFPVRVKNDRTDRIYVATETGLVVCIRERDQNFPIYHMFPERRPILPEFAPETPEAAPEAESP